MDKREQTHDLTVPFGRSINRLGPTRFGPNAQILSAIPTQSLPHSSQIFSSAGQNSSGLTSFAPSSSPPPAVVSCFDATRSREESSSSTETRAPRRSDWIRRMVEVLAWRKEVILIGRGTARMVKLTMELVVDPRMVPRGASLVLVGAMSGKEDES